LDYYSYFQAIAHIDPWSHIRRIEWNDTKNLADLFESESLTTYYGHFFDQRFIDYLAANFQSIDNINWRHFEGLVCEFFEREGFYVEIGPGRNDNNIDARIWPKEEDSQAPPAILVQCKRTRASVGKLVVKALWADIQAERATSGLIVTTSSLAVGAREIATARAYPIVEANRTNLTNWILSMRSPNSGVFLGE
jgi:restriction system protein